MLINLIKDSWVLVETIKVVVVPRVGELIYSNLQQKYFKVTNVIHQTSTQEIFMFTRQIHIISLVVEEVDKK